MLYDDFKAAVEQYCGLATAGRLVPIPVLRRALGRHLASDEFDALLCALQSDGHVHLLTHVDAHSLSEDDRKDSLSHPTGILAYWVCWAGRATI